VATAQGRQAHHRDPLGRKAAQLLEHLLRRPRALEGAGGHRRVAAAHDLGGFVEDRRDLLDDPSGLLPGALQAGGRHEHADDEGDASADDRVEPPGEGLPRRSDERDDDGRLDARLDREQQPRPDEGRDGHGDHDHEEELEDAGAEDMGEHVADEHPEGHPDHHLDGAAHPLPVGHAQRDDGGDRGEERHGVVDDVSRHPPRERRPEAALPDEGEAGSQPVGADPGLGPRARRDACGQVGGGRHTGHHPLPDSLPA
jgi:hypothetical protein